VTISKSSAGRTRPAFQGLSIGVQRTAALLGYNRTLSFPVAAGPGRVASFPDPAFNAIGADFEVHAAPRTPNAPFQSFDTDMFRLFGQRGFAQGND